MPCTGSGNEKLLEGRDAGLDGDRAEGFGERAVGRGVRRPHNRNVADDRLHEVLQEKLACGSRRAAGGCVANLGPEVVGAGNKEEVANHD